MTWHNEVVDDALSGNMRKRYALILLLMKKVSLELERDSLVVYVCVCVCVYYLLLEINTRFLFLREVSLCETVLISVKSL